MTILPKSFYMFSAIPIKIPMTFITEIEKSTLKYIWKHKRPQIAKEILSKRSSAGSITVPDFKQYYTAIAIKTEWYWHKCRYEDQWNRINYLAMNSHSYTHLIFNKGAKKQKMENRQPLQQMLLGKVANCLQKIATRSVFVTLHKYQLKVD
jgi:hypothetical protein